MTGAPVMVIEKRDRARVKPDLHFHLHRPIAWVRSAPACDTDDASIAHAVITMSHSLRLKVIEEGVENEAQLSFLMANGCDEMQGLLFLTAAADRRLHGTAAGQAQTGRIAGGEGHRLAQRQATPPHVFTASVIAFKSVSGSCAPEAAIRRLKMKNGTPLMPASRASTSPRSIWSRSSSEAR